jgi:hypothetical protein
VNSSGFASKKGPSSRLRSEPRKPSERLSGLTCLVRRMPGTYVQTESGRLASRYRQVSEMVPFRSAGDTTVASCWRRRFCGFARSRASGMPS